MTKSNQAYPTDLIIREGVRVKEGREPQASAMIIHRLLVELYE